jgi:hypothetical protein
MTQDPGNVAPLDWMFMPGIFFQPPQIITIEVSIHGLLWWNKFLMHDAFGVKKINIDLTLLQTCYAFLGHSEFGIFH